MTIVTCTVCGFVTTSNNFLQHVCNGKSRTGTYAAAPYEQRPATPQEARQWEAARNESDRARSVMMLVREERSDDYNRIDEFLKWGPYSGQTTKYLEMESLLLDVRKEERKIADEKARIVEQNLIEQLDGLRDRFTALLGQKDAEIARLVKGAKSRTKQASPKHRPRR